jgi:hypothetical protein
LSVTDGPPTTGTLRQVQIRLPGGLEQKPMRVPSGEKNGMVAPSVPERGVPVNS